MRACNPVFYTKTYTKNTYYGSGKAVGMGGVALTRRVCIVFHHYNNLLVWVVSGSRPHSTRLFLSVPFCL